MPDIKQLYCLLTCFCSSVLVRLMSAVDVEVGTPPFLTAAPTAAVAFPPVPLLATEAGVAVPELFPELTGPLLPTVPADLRLAPLVSARSSASDSLSVLVDRLILETNNRHLSVSLLTVDAYE